MMNHKRKGPLLHSGREGRDGAEALRAAIASPPDVVALDVSMPGMDGYGVCRALRGNPRTSRVPVLLLTGAPSEELQRLDSPPDGWIAKPFRLADIVAKVTALLPPVRPASELERGRHEHRACDLEVELFIPGEGAGRNLGAGTLIAIGPSGGLLSFPGSLRRGAACDIRLTKPVAAVLSCRIWREAGASDGLRYYGVNFDLSPAQEEALAGLLETLSTREPVNAEERCSACGAAITVGIGRFRGDKTFCARCQAKTGG